MQYVGSVCFAGSSGLSAKTDKTSGVCNKKWIFFFFLVKRTRDHCDLEKIRPLHDKNLYKIIFKSLKPLVSFGLDCSWHILILPKHLFLVQNSLITINGCRGTTVDLWWEDPRFGSHLASAWFEEPLSKTLNPTRLLVVGVMFTLVWHAAVHLFFWSITDITVGM